MKANLDFFFAAGVLTALLGAVPASAEPVHAPAGLSAADWASVRAEYERHRHALQPAESGFRGRNLGQSWTVELDGRGVTVEPDHRAWSWGLELVSYGYAGRAEAVAAPARVSGEVERVTYAWDGRLEEWFVNESRGLEHGFTLRRAPDGAGETLELNLHVRGGWTAAIDADGRGAGFARPGGGAALRYAGLRAWDADGRELAARLETAAGGLRMAVDVRGVRYPVTIDPLAQEAYVKASNTGTLDYFGWSVSLSGDTLAVGAYNEASNGTGVNPGTQGNNSAAESGAVYVFRRVSGVWTQQAYIKASNTGASDRFGYSVSLSGDTLAVGAPSEDSNGTGVNSNTQSNNSAANSGAVYVFLRTGGVWAQQAYIKASNTGAGDSFGFAVSLSGNTLAVSALGEDGNGTGVNPNSQANNAALESGAVYVFQRTGSAWAQQAYIKASNTEAFDFFGYSVALSGDTLAVGAIQESSSGAGVNPNAQADNSLIGSGAVYVFQRTGSVWAQQAYIKASNPDEADFFGYSVALSGNTLAVGASQESGNGVGVNSNAQADNSLSASGAAYVFERTGTVWAQQAYIKASNTGAGDLFGSTVALSGNHLAVGAPIEAGGGTGVNPNAQGDNSAPASGAVYVFQRNGAAWTQQSYVKASNTGGGDQFGLSLAISGDHVAVGAPFEDSNGTGVNPNAQGNNSASNSGAVYVFAGLTSSQGSAGSNVAVYRPGVWLADKNANGVFDPGTDLYFLFGFPGSTPIAGDWNGDGRQKAGLYANGFWYLDYDGNGVWDGGVVDKQYEFGWAGVKPFVGDWNGDGRDKIGIYINGFWFLDANGNGVWNGPGVDIQAEFGWAPVTPLVGDWNGDGRDKIGIFINGFWYLDYNGNARWDGPVTDREAHFGYDGVTPLTGDWNGDGRETIGFYTNGFWYLDANGNGVWNGPGVDIQAHFGFPGVTPLRRDWNGDGRDKMGLFINGQWYIDYDGSATWDGGIVDKAFTFGQAGDTPFVGPW